MRAALVATLLVLLAVPVAAQTPAQPPVAPLPIPPLPWLVLDLRGGFASSGQDGTTAAGLKVAPTDMPGRLRSAVVGAHFYPFRRGGFKLGLGGELLLGSASGQKKDTTGAGVGPVIRRRLNAVSGQISLNFGKGGGWSYLTAGGGPLKFESYLDEATPDGVGATTINYGGGARWFTNDHLAFAVDLRFYLTRPALATTVTAARARERVFLLSLGISLK
jgi:hypothetical protein